MPAALPHANAPEWELRLALGFVLVQAMKKSAPIEALPFGWTAEFDLLVADNVLYSPDWRMLRFSAFAVNRSWRLRTMDS